MIKHQPPRPVCKHCNRALAKPNGISKHGFQQWHKFCVTCAKMLYAHKRAKCEGCGFIPEDLCQLDLVYKDGNRHNKEKSNLKTLCANCNRLYKKKQRGKKTILDITVDADIRI